MILELNAKLYEEKWQAPGFQTIAIVSKPFKIFYSEFDAIVSISMTELCQHLNLSLLNRLRNYASKSFMAGSSWISIVLSKIHILCSINKMGKSIESEITRFLKSPF